MKTIKLSSNRDKNVAYFLSSITKQQYETILAIRERYKQDILDNNLYHYNGELNELSLLWGIDCKGVLKIGETDDTSTSDLVEYITTFKGKDTEGAGHVGYNREIHYRDYSRALNSQKKISWLVNVYQDSRASVASAIRQMDDEYCCVWETTFNSKFNKQFTDDICFLKL